MSCFCVGGKREHLPPTAWRYRCHGQGHRMNQMEISSRVFINESWLNAPVDATSETLLFWCFSFIEIWFQFIQSSGRKLVISLCQTRISMQRHYSPSTQCPAAPSPASGLLRPPPFPHPWGKNLIIVRIPIRRWRWFNLLHIWFLCPIWYWQPLTTPAVLQSFCWEDGLSSNMGVGIEFGHAFGQAVKAWECIGNSSDNKQTECSRHVLYFQK